MVVLVSVEIVNLIVVLTNTTVMETIMNFLALVIISDFDDYYFQTVKNEPLCKLVSDGTFNFGFYEGEDNDRKLEEIIKIEATNSWNARFKIQGNGLKSKKVT